MTDQADKWIPTVGMVGAGQLARMTCPAATELAVGFRLLADSAGDSAARVWPDVQLGDYRSLADLRAFAAGCDVVTFDHEHVPPAHLAALEEAGVVLRPGPQHHSGLLQRGQVGRGHVLVVERHHITAGREGAQVSQGPVVAELDVGPDPGGAVAG